MLNIFKYGIIKNIQSLNDSFIRDMFLHATLHLNFYGDLMSNSITVQLLIFNLPRTIKHLLLNKYQMT